MSSPPPRPAAPGPALVSVLFFLSGAAGLVYQVAWSQEFARVLGASEIAVAVVLASFLGGLAGGAAVAGRWAYRLRNPLAAWGFLEASIGGFALSFGPLLAAAGRIQARWLGGLDEVPSAADPRSGLVGFAIAATLLLAPTFAMGASLPVLVRAVVGPGGGEAARTGRLYAANTAGAAAGAGAAAFLLLPALGLDAAVRSAAAVNLAVAAAALVASRRGARGPEAEVHPTAPLAGSGEPGLAPPDLPLPLVLAIVAAAGFVSFTTEVLWTRLLVHLLGGTVFAFGALLSSVLIGLAAGAALASRAAADGDRERARTWLAVSLGTTALLLLALLPAVDRLAPDLARLDPPGTLLPMRRIAASAVALLPLWISVGALFPLAVTLASSGWRQAPRAAARVYAWNTAGGIAGALGGGLLLLPATGFAATNRLLVGLASLLGVTVFLAGGGRGRRWGALAPAALALAGALAVPLREPTTLVRLSPFGTEPGRLALLAVGRSSTVTLFDQGDVWRLSTNGLPESLVHGPGGRSAELRGARWMAHLPLLANPGAKEMLVVGLGGGVILEELPSGLERVDVVELEPEVVAANRRLATERRRDPLADPRVRVVVNDARSVLRLSAHRWDAIVSQPSHPWTSGSANLYTREFFELAKGRLAPGGAFVQWMGAPFVDERLLASLVATLTSVFGSVELYLPDPQTLLFLATDVPVDGDAPHHLAFACASEGWGSFGVDGPAALDAARRLDAAGARRFADGSPLVTDGRNLFQTGAPRLRTAGDAFERLDAALAPFDPLATAIDRAGEGAPLEAALDRLARLAPADAARRGRRLAARLPQGEPRQRALARIELDGSPEERAAARGRLARLAAERPLSPALAELAVAAFADDIRRGAPLSFATDLPAGPAADLAAAFRGEPLVDAEGRPTPLDDRLAARGRASPAHAELLRLRVRARLGSADPGAARSALALLDRGLVGAAAPIDLLLRAETAIAAGDDRIALASLGEALRGVERGRIAGPVLQAILDRLDSLEARLGPGPTAPLRDRLAPLLR